MAQPNPSSVRVLVRPPHPTTSIAPSLSASISSATSAATSSTSHSLPSPPSSSPPPEGVVVVGFVGSRSSIESTHLINRILDANVFGSGNLDKDLFVSRLESCRRGKEWFRHRRISYHHEKEKGIVFLQFSSSLSHLSLLSTSRIGEGEYSSASALEELEADDLRGMLFMFSVCHVIIFLHEGLRFDTHILKRFRILQNAKHALSPFIRSKVAPTLTNNTPLNSHPTAARITSIPSHSRRGVTSRHGSSISLMSGSGSNSAVLPGQCTPVILFVFIGDLLDESNPSTIPEESVDAPFVAQLSSNAGGLSKPTLSSKGSGPVVVLARPASKTEGSFKKKLQSSLETQLRFLVKRCRTLVGTEHGNHSSRNATSLSTLPLFLFDSSKVVTLLDRSLIQRGESLDIITDLIEDAFNSKSTLDINSLEDHCQNANNEDIQAIKDFLYRQVDAIKGRGGLPSNASSGTVAGVGIVAAAAAAAAASAAAGKTLTSPDLPNLQHWLSLSNLILDSLISIDDIFLDEEGKLNKLSLEKDANETQENEISVEDRKAISAAVSCLESSKGLNFKFSISWCQRALPAAKNVYLNELPPFYPTVLHKAHLKRALHAFSSMVKGPATLAYSRKLEQECTEIWESGRQLCDTVSLTGKPCMHQRHDDEKQHSSGYVFLHACACGRSRRLRDDPFDFESANITFSCFANCEDLLPYLILPRDNLVGSLPQNSWRLMRIAGARYYKPSKGLLQNGFSSTEKYLLKWEISLDKQKEVNSLPLFIAEKSSSTDVVPESKISFISDEAKKNDADRLQWEPKSGRSENMVKKLEMGPLNNSSISFGKGLPSFPVKKPFSEVVAGTSGGDPFPSFQHKKPPKASADTGLRKAVTSEQFINRVSAVDSREGPQKTEHKGTQGNVLGSTTNEQIDGNPVLQIGSNIVPVNFGGEKIFRDDCSKQVNIFVGFEHECAYGHRFLLSLDHLQDLESKFSANELHSFTDGSETTTETRNGLHKKDPENSMATVTSINNTKRTNRSAERSDKSNGRHGSITLLSRSENARSEPANGHPLPAGCQQKFDRNISCVKLDDGASAFSLLNRKLPVYMNCPYCKSLSSKDKMKISDTVSQLQRIFIVTPKFPTVLGTCPVVQFDDSCLPPSVPNREQQTRFSFGCQVFLPPESFLTLKLPFVYGVQMDNGCLQPLNPLVQKPELTAWLMEGTTLQIISLGHEDDEMMQKIQG